MAPPHLTFLSPGPGARKQNVFTVFETNPQNFECFEHTSRQVGQAFRLAGRIRI